MSHTEENRRSEPAAPSSSTAAGPWPRQHLVEPRMFGGKPGEDVDEWLNHYERVSKHYCWDSAARLANVVFFLTETALMWFDNHEEALTTWDRFISDIKERFGDSVAKKKHAEQTLLQRAQLPGETCTTYIETILKLCRMANPRMPEEDKVGHLLKGIAEDVYNFLIGKESLSSVADVIRHCRTFEALKLRRITPKFGRLANVTTVASIEDDTSSADLANTIRQIVREELSRCTELNNDCRDAQQSHLPSPAPRDLSIAATTVGERHSRRPVWTQHNYHPEEDNDRAAGYPRRAAYLEPRTYPAYPNVSREPPVCYTCGITGHISRFCPHRRRSPRWYEPQPTSYGTERRNYDHSWPPCSFAPPVSFRNNTSRQNPRSDSPISDRSLTPPPSRQHRSPSPRRRSFSPPTSGN